MGERVDALALVGAALVFILGALELAVVDVALDLDARDELAGAAVARVDGERVLDVAEAVPALDSVARGAISARD